MPYFKNDNINILFVYIPKTGCVWDVKILIYLLIII